MLGSSSFRARCIARRRARSSSRSGRRGCSRPCGCGRCRGPTVPGRWFFGSHWPNSSRKLMMRSLARAFSSSRRAPPMQASKPNSSMASSSVTDWCLLRDSPSCLSTTVPRASSSLRPSGRSAARRVRRRACRGRQRLPCSCGRCRCAAAGRGSLPGRKAFSARRSMQIESLPPEKRSTGLAHWPATSRMMWMASASSQSRWLRAVAVGAAWRSRRHGRSRCAASAR
jgi:hypothetical protein